MNTLTIRRIKGFANWYYRGLNVTALWLDFFSGLSSEQEEKCVTLFMKKYRKYLNNYVRSQARRKESRARK